MKISKEEKKELNGFIHRILELKYGKCLRCKKPHFQASHIYPKGSYRKMEFDSKNIIPLCFFCHLYWWHKHPIEAHEWIKTALKPGQLRYLKLRSYATGKGSRDYIVLRLFLLKELEELQK